MHFSRLARVGAILGSPDVHVKFQRAQSERWSWAKAFFSHWDKKKNSWCAEVAYVGSIHPDHYPTMKLLLEHGKHVLCEKPLTMNRRDTEDICRMAKEKKLFLMEVSLTKTAYFLLITERSWKCTSIAKLVARLHFCVFFPKTMHLLLSFRECYLMVILRTPFVTCKYRNKGIAVIKKKEKHWRQVTIIVEWQKYASDGETAFSMRCCRS